MKMNKKTLMNEQGPYIPPDYYKPDYYKWEPPWTHTGDSNIYYCSAPTRAFSFNASELNLTKEK